MVDKVRRQLQGAGAAEGLYRGDSGGLLFAKQQALHLLGKQRRTFYRRVTVGSALFKQAPFGRFNRLHQRDPALLIIIKTNTQIHFLRIFIL